jgi:hypothetical protein
MFPLCAGSLTHDTCESRIGLQQVFSKKKTSAVLYNVMRPNTNKIQGEIEVQLTFEPKVLHK